MKLNFSRKNTFLLALSGLLLASLLLNVFLFVTQKKQVPTPGSNFQKIGLIKKVTGFFGQGNPYVYFAMMDQVFDLEPRLDKKDAPKIPDFLIIKPGLYSFKGEVFDLNRQGLYRLIVPGQINLQRIVYNDDVEALLSGLAWIVTHGNLDNRNSISEQLKKGAGSKLFLSCGPLTFFAHRVLKAAGWVSREVMALAPESNEYYVREHVLLEVYRPKLGKWVVYDLDSNAFFTANGTPLSLLEFFDRQGSQDYQVKLLADDVRTDVSTYFSGDFNHALIMERFKLTSNLKGWYARVFKTVLIKEQVKTAYYFDAAYKDRVEKIFPEPAFMKREDFEKAMYGPGSIKNNW